MAHLKSLYLFAFACVLLCIELNSANSTNKTKPVTKPTKPTAAPKAVVTTKPAEEAIVVKTKTGSLKGKAIKIEYNPTNDVKTLQKQKVNAFLGIPYAEKPIGDLRFKQSVAMKNWTGMFDATNLPNSCFQVVDNSIPQLKGRQMWNPSTKLSEDCLYLNIWTPNPMPKNANVIVISIFLNCKN